MNILHVNDLVLEQVHLAELLEKSLYSIPSALHDSALVQLLLNKLLQKFGGLNSMSPEFLAENKTAKPPTKTYLLYRGGLSFRDVDKLSGMKDKLQQTAALSQSRHNSMLWI